MQTTVTVIETSKEAVNVINDIKTKLQNSPTGVSFFGIKGYTNKNGETSNYTINIGVDYGKSIEADILFLENLDVTTLTGKKSSSVDLLTAKTALIEAFKKPNANISAGQTEAYETIAPNVKRHLTNNLLYVTGSMVNKKVLVKGTYKTVKSSSLTIAKIELRNMLKSSKIRQFVLDVYNLDFEILYTVNTDVYGDISIEAED